MKNKTLKILFSILGVSIILVLIASIFVDVAMARPGGGHSYSGGGGGGFSGGGGGGGGDLAGLIIWLILQLPPQISIPLLIVIAIGYIIHKRKQSKNATVVSAPTHQNRTTAVNNSDTLISSLKTVDPNFSKVLFLEFVSSLYNKYYALQGNGQIGTLKPFIADHIVAEVKNRAVKRQINEIVIGSIRISGVNMYSQVTAIMVDIDSNFTITINGKSTRYVVTERWLMNRKAGVLSQEPEKMQKLACPNCGAPVNFSDSGTCNHCGTFIEQGSMQWYLKDRKLISQRTFSTNSLLTYSQEVGTNYPTIFQEGLTSQVHRFSSMHQTNWDSFESTFKNNTVIPYFNQIYNAWTIQRWEKVRHLVADRLWESNNYWVEAYKQAGLINKLENINISRIDVARLDFDRYYESITVRIFASSLDYVTDRSGKLRAGNNRRPRQFSEYWTFIRRTGVTKEAFDLSTCPNCGAPADKMGQAGVCEYCGTKITTGEFSWVLAIITQDEEYRG